MSLLEQMGYTRVGHYGGGIREWRRAALPFDKGWERSVRPEERTFGGEVPRPP